jgi:signal transduction histidine kinase
MLIASLVGFGGGITNFLPQLFNIYPFGNFLTLLYLFFMSYGVLKYKFISKKVISAQLLVGAVVLIFLFNFLQLLQTGADASLQNILVALLLLILVSVFGVLIVRGVYREVSQREKIELLAANLKTANDNQVNLIHIMNHQIKGKLGDARAAFAELLTDDYGTIPEAAMVIVKKGLEETETGVNYVQGILKGLSAENGTLPYEMKEMDLAELVKKVTDKSAEKARAKNLVFEVNVAKADFKMNGDATELSEALRNLLENSIAYTLSGSIHVWLTRKGDKALIAVQDTGVGISAEDKEKLFRSGGRGKDSIKVNVDSTGYGLSFVKGVVEAHHGRVWAESDGPGKGSSFYMELCLKSA